MYLWLIVWLVRQVHAINFKMADKSAKFIVSVKDYRDPSESYPRNDQAVVFEAARDLKIEDYVIQMNEYIQDPKSFIQGSRISGDRTCVVMATAAQATKSVEEVKTINVNN